MRILVVDDHPSFREFLTSILRADAALEVVGEADSGEEGLRLAEQLEPEVVLMEMEMPRLNGVDAARQLKTRRRQTRVILMSMLGDDKRRKTALESGADGFLAKLDTPVSELLSVVRGGKEPPEKTVERGPSSGV